MKDRKKTLFMIMCYLLVCVMMVGNFSLARYKKEIEAEILMPQASNFQASMELSPVSESLGYKVTMTGMMPGKTAEYKYNHSTDTTNPETASMKFTVMNYASVTGTSGTTTEVSETPLDYNIRVYGERHIPLSLVLCHKPQGSNETEVYKSVCRKTNTGYVYTFETKATGAVEADEAVFRSGEILADKEERQAQENDVFTLYIGWAEEDEWKALDKNVKTAIDYFDSYAYAKEVEHLEIRAIVRGAYIGTDAPAPENGKTGPDALPGLLFVTNSTGTGA